MTRRDLERHYGERGLADRVLAALGPDDAPLDPRDLAALDQFHIGGAGATRRLAALAGVVAGMRVLDVGCGLGGPARLLAGALGAEVTGIDLMSEYCRIADRLNARTGLAGKVGICAADAVRLPFADGAFDLVWSEHVAMNIADRAALYDGFARAVRPGGRLALYDVVEGPAPGALVLPLPWAREAGQSHLLPADAFVRAVEAAGWRPLAVEDESADALAWFAAQQAGPSGGPPAVKSSGSPAGRPALGLVMGAEFPTMVANLRRNLAAGRLGVVQAVFEKTA